MSHAISKAAELTSGLPRVPRVSVIDSKHARHLARWMASLAGFRDLLNTDEPWITFHAIDWLERVVRREWRVAEFGSGASTLYWARRVSEVVSVEHHRGWYTRLTEVLREDGYANVRSILAEPSAVIGPITRYLSQKKGYEDRCFEAYARALDTEPEASFDLVFVDGRARVACCEAAISKVRPGGYLVLDNAERDRYRELHDRFAHLRRIDLTSMGPRQIGRWTTSVWRVS